MKTVYEEALNDMKQLREVAEANARNTIIDSLAPKLKDLIEKNLSNSTYNEGDEDLDETAAGGGFGTTVGTAHPEMTGATSGTGQTFGSGSDEGDKDAEDEKQSKSFEVKEESYEPLFHLSKLAGPALMDRIIAEVYKTYDSVNEVITGTRTMNSDELNITIRKIEDIYSYLQENSVENKPKLEEKLETCYGLLNSFRESKMKMKELVSEEKDVTLRITGLPDDVELENLNIDIISDEEPEGEEGMPDEDAMGSPGGSAPPAGPPGPPGMGESMYGEGVEDVNEEDDLGEGDNDGDADDVDEAEKVLTDEDAVVEVSIPMLRKAIASVKEAKGRLAKTPGSKGGVDSDVLSDFGGGKDEGDPWLDSDMERLGEGDEVDEGDEDLDELQNRRKRDEKGREQADDHLQPESVNRMLKLAAHDLRESKAWYLKHVGTKNEAGARKVVERAAKRFERVKELADRRLGPAAKKVNEAVAKSKAAEFELVENRKENDGLRKQLAEVNLLNSKLIHANKLLQREGLTKNQKMTVIDRLDEAMSLREVRLIYESLTKAFEDDGKGSIRENVSRRPKAAGSSSRTTTSSERPVISEGMETARWLELAGLSTK